jgi:hypothetical protein
MTNKYIKLLEDFDPTMGNEMENLSNQGNPQGDSWVGQLSGVNEKLLKLKEYVEYFDKLNEEYEQFATMVKTASEEKERMVDDIVVDFERIGLKTHRAHGLLFKYTRATQRMLPPSAAESLEIILSICDEAKQIANRLKTETEFKKVVPVKRQFKISEDPDYIPESYGSSRFSNWVKNLYDGVAGWVKSIARKLRTNVEQLEIEVDNLESSLMG